MFSEKFYCDKAIKYQISKREIEKMCLLAFSYTLTRQFNYKPKYFPFSCFLYSKSIRVSLWLKIKEKKLSGLRDQIINIHFLLSSAIQLHHFSISDTQKRNSFISDFLFIFRHFFPNNFLFVDLAEYTFIYVLF